MRPVPAPPVSLDREVYNYLYQLQEIINLALVEQEDVAEGGTKVNPAGLPGSTAESLDAMTVAQLKALIIKTADTVTIRETIIAAEEAIAALRMKLEQEYVAVSQFGEYMKTTTAEWDTDATGQEQRYTILEWIKANLGEVSAAFEQYKSQMEGYIRLGIIDEDEDGTPVIGVAVGQDLLVKEWTDPETGEKTIEVDKRHFRATFSPKRISLWEDANEVAWIASDMLHARNAVIEGNLQTGEWLWDSGDGMALLWAGGAV